MRRQSLINLAACGALAIGSAGLVAAQDDVQGVGEKLQQQLNDWMTAQQESGANLTYEMYQAKVAELLEDVDFTQLSASDIANLGQMLGAAGEETQTAAADRLEQLSTQEDVQGAIASITQVQFVAQTQDPEQIVPALRKALDHPALQQAFEQGFGADAVAGLPYLGAESLNQVSDEMVALSDKFTDKLPPAFIGSTMGYMDALAEIESVTPEQRNAVREKLTGLYEGAIATLNEEGNEQMAARLERGLAYMNGAYARGELIDHVAPTVNFTWHSGEGELATLADLKGKVVVLDFWATWCGPCIASFPNVKELQERYNGYDVAIVGVTSLQGRHYPGDAPPVDTTDNPEKEYELMKEFMTAKDMTWAVAFTEQDVFNPDFGVRGIPHVAIIDAEGKVRYNGLHPASPLAEKTEKIDKLLKEAGLPAPAPVGEADGDDSADGGDGDG